MVEHCEIREVSDHNFKTLFRKGGRSNRPVGAIGSLKSLLVNVAELDAPYNIVL